MRDGADDEGVGPGAAGQDVRAGPARDRVGARAAVDGVHAGAAGDGVGAAEIGADDGDAIGAGEAGGVDRHAVGHRHRRAELQVVLGAVAIGVGGRDLAVRHRHVEAGCIHVERDGVDVGDGGERGQVVGAGGVEPQRVCRPGLCRAVDGLAGGEMRDGADDERVGPGAAGQDVRPGSARDHVGSRAAVDGVHAGAAVDGVGAAEIGTDDGDAIGAGQAGGVDRHAVGHRHCGADLQVVLGAVAVGVGGRDLAVRHRQVEAGGVHVERDGVDIGDGGEAGQVVGAGGIEPQRVSRAGLGRAVDGLAGGEMRDGADDEGVGPGAAGQDVRPAPPVITSAPAPPSMVSTPRRR